MPERIVALGAGVLLVGSVVGAVRHLDSGSEPAAGADEVTISDFQFGPRDLTVAAGATVTWRNQDGFDHTVAGDGAEPALSPSIGEGDTYEFTFEVAGTYEYRCTIHPNMQGTIVVEGS